MQMGPNVEAGIIITLLTFEVIKVMSELFSHLV
jgi:hypothetical protein